MNLIKCEKLEKSMAELQFSIDAEAFKKAVADVFKKEGKKYPVQGFRKGKAPRKMIEKLYGEGVFYEEAFDLVFPDMYRAAVEENHLEATLEEYRYITERLNAYDNVTVYFFPACEDIICDLNHYADYSHYHPRFNRFMTECFVSGSYRVSKETAGQTASQNTEENLQKADVQPEEKTIDEYLEEMRRIVDHYDFDTLHEKIAVWNP